MKDTQQFLIHASFGQYEITYLIEVNIHDLNILQDYSSPKNNEAIIKAFIEAFHNTIRRVFDGEIQAIEECDYVVLAQGKAKDEK